MAKSKGGGGSSGGSKGSSSSSSSSKSSSAAAKSTGFGAAVANAARSISDALSGRGQSPTVTDPKTGKTYDRPSYGALSFQGLTSTDPANVARNREGAARMSMLGGETRDRDSNRPVAAPAAPAAEPVRKTLPVPVVEMPMPPAAPAPVVPVQPPAPPVAAPVVEGPKAADVPLSTGIGSSTAAGGQAEAAAIAETTNSDVEKAAGETAAKGRRSTILTTAQGLLAETSGQLRRRRSLLGGGLIA